jgi:NAD(P)H-hydrate epimerase
LQPLLTAAETEALDRETERRGTSVEVLMERAGHAVARAASAVAGGSYGRRAVVVCGKGNNGGDGLVAARHLSGWGMGVEVILLSDELRSPADAKLRAAGDAGVRVGGVQRLERALDRADVVVDAIFGTGFRGIPEGAYATAIEHVNGATAPVLAVDVPSGVEGDTGAVRGPAVVADATVTFGAPKVGDVLFPGAAHAGVLDVADIGFPPDLVRGEMQLVEAEDAAAWWPSRAVDAHKRSSGVVLVVAGSRGMPGAARLVASGAARAGAGLVTVAAPESALAAIQAGLAEATAVPLLSTPAGGIAEDAWPGVEALLGRVDAVAVGPGLTTEDEPSAFVRRLVSASPVPVVLDADGLNAYRGRGGDLAAHEAPLILTPHAGELARLLGVDEIDEDRPGLTRKLASDVGAVVLLKGPATLIASPSEMWVSATGTSALATGGTGDVLTGMIGALAARGVEGVRAAACGAFVHGMAGRLAAGPGGEGAIASEVAAAIPAAVAALRGLA